MEHLLTTLVAVLIACVCVTSLPVNEGDDISKLAHLLGKIRSLSRKRLDSQNWAHFKASHGDAKPGLSNLEDSKDELADDIMPSLTDDVTSLKKRQGAWSYDYGLGGGRFGKRTLGDYGIGGGRFGRDVDHVDLAD